MLIGNIVAATSIRTRSPVNPEAYPSMIHSGDDSLHPPFRLF
jgi:hypothetical protein